MIKTVMRWLTSRDILFWGMVAINLTTLVMATTLFDNRLAATIQGLCSAIVLMTITDIHARRIEREKAFRSFREFSEGIQRMLRQHAKPDISQAPPAQQKLADSAPDDPTKDRWS